MLPLVLLCGMLAGPVEDPTSTKDDERLKRQVVILVGKLNNDSSAVRVEAEKALLKLGPAILDLLPPVTDNTPAEVKQRLDGVRKALESAAAESAGQAALVTLQGEMKLSAALAAIKKQTGNEIVDYRQQFGQQIVDPTLKLELKDASFWEAIDDVLDRSGTNVYAYGGEGALAIVAVDEQAVPRVGRAHYSGLFRFEGLSVESIRNLRRRDGGSMNLTMEVAWEPRSKPIALELPFDKMVAVDENGNNVELTGQQQRFEVAVQADAVATELRLPFGLPSREIKKIASLKGELVALVPGRRVKFIFDDIKNAQAIEKENGGVTVVFERVRKNADLYELRMRLRFVKSANALDSHRDWIYRNKAVLVDSKGKEYQNAALDAARTADNEAALTFLFDVQEDLKGYKFVYESPALILSLPVPFEIKDIDLP
ncbi:MAG: hypothetical protein ACI9HK_001608 [Pirellulaceae bacterium]|jgi:hypothetical protein